MRHRVTLIRNGIGLNIDLIDGKLYYQNRPITKIILGNDVPLEIHFKDECWKESHPVTAIFVRTIEE